MFNTKKKEWRAPGFYRLLVHSTLAKNLTNGDGEGIFSTS